MRSDGLRADQLQAVAAVVARHGNYLGKLRDRMRALRFPEDDPLFVAVSRAWEAASNVTVVASSAAAKRPVMERRPWAGG
jgi:hypothetical protein